MPAIAYQQDGTWNWYCTSCATDRFPTDEEGSVILDDEASGVAVRGLRESDEWCDHGDGSRRIACDACYAELVSCSCGECGECACECPSCDCEVSYCSNCSCGEDEDDGPSDDADEGNEDCSCDACEATVRYVVGEDSEPVAEWITKAASPQLEVWT